MKGVTEQSKHERLNWVLPSLALGYVPFVFLLSFASPVDNYSLTMLSGVALLALLPIHTVILIWLTRQRIKNGTNTIGLTLFQLISFIVPLLFLIAVLSFNGSPA